MRLLVVEDNAKLSELLAQGLAQAGFESDRVTRLSAAEEALGRHHLFGDDPGSGLARRRRAQPGDQSARQGRCHIPVLMLTARDGLEDKVAGLASRRRRLSGQALRLRGTDRALRALLRRPGEFLGNRISAGNVTFDTGARQVFVTGKPVSFSARETGAARNPDPPARPGGPQAAGRGSICSACPRKCAPMRWKSISTGCASN